MKNVASIAVRKAAHGEKVIAVLPYKSCLAMSRCAFCSQPAQGAPLNREKS